MSNLPFNVEDKRVIVSIVVLLLAVVILNWRVFQPLRSNKTRQQVTQSDEVYVPDDLDGLKYMASQRLALANSGNAPAQAGSFGAGAGLRDPFRKSTDPTPAPIRGRSGSTKTSRQQVKLSCTAVLLGGKQPTALINNKPCHPGDIVAGYRIVRIDETGVLLDNKSRRRFLPVGAGTNDQTHYPPVHSKPASDKRTADR